MNVALVFIKPHAVTDNVKALVERVLKDNKISITKEGDVSGAEIEAKSIIDRHYAAIARYAMTWTADKHVLSESAKAQFKEKFGVAWDDEVKAGHILNAAEATKKVGGPSQLTAQWDANPDRLKLAPGLYVGHFKEDKYFVLMASTSAIGRSSWRQPQRFTGTPWSGRRRISVGRTFVPRSSARPTRKRRPTTALGA
jgi:hypothetical protein